AFTTRIDTLSLHHALPICTRLDNATLRFDVYRFAELRHAFCRLLQHAGFFDREMNTLRLNVFCLAAHRGGIDIQIAQNIRRSIRSEEHTSELQSRENLVCR